MRFKLGKSNMGAFLIILLIIVLIWGFIGGQQAQQIGITCDIGIGDSLCWKWHKNVIGQAQDFISNVLK